MRSFERVLAKLRERGPSTSRELAKDLGVKPRIVQNALYRLVAHDQVLKAYNRGHETVFAPYDRPLTYELTRAWPDPVSVPPINKLKGRSVKHKLKY